MSCLAWSKKSKARVPPNARFFIRRGHEILANPAQRRVVPPSVGKGRFGDAFYENRVIEVEDAVLVV